MNIRVKNLAVVALTLVSATCLARAEESGPVVRVISTATGAFANPGSTWNQYWTSTATDPVVKLSSSRNDMKAAASGGLDLREGSAKTSTYTISTEGAWRVTAFSLTFRGNSAADPVTVSSGAVTLTSDAGADKTLNVSNIGEFESAGFTLSGNNQGITTSEFRVTLEPTVPEEYVEATVDMTTGGFDETSEWKSLWHTPSTAPLRVYLAAETGGKGTKVLNMKAAASGSGLDLHEGTAGSSDYIISTAGSYRVSGFELTFKGKDDANPVTVSSGGSSVTSSATEERTLTVDNVAYGAKATFNIAGNNKGITTTSFKVRLTPMSPDSRGVCVFPYSASQPYSTVYRIPTLAYIPAGKYAGRIVAVNDFRPCGADIGYGEVDLHTSISTDGGYTWTDPANPVDADGNHVADGDGQGSPATSNENRDCGFGDPAIVADRESGHLLMLGVCGRVPIGQATRAIPQGLATWTSTDGGDTWTQWKDITEDILTQLDNNCDYGAVDGLFFTAGRLVQSKYVKVGSHYRVYAVGGGRSASIPDTQCWVFYTDDFGQSWHILGNPYNPALTTGGSEPKCEELPDGSVLFSGRIGGGRTFNVFTYTDYEKAEGTWDEAVFGRMVTGAASCNGDAMIVPVVEQATGKGAYLLMQSIPQHPNSRVNVGINYKVLANGFDDFGSPEAVASDWSGSWQVTNLPSAYSSLTLMNDGTLGFIYEENTFGRSYSEVYRNLTVEQLTRGAYTYAPDADGATALRLTRELVAGKLARAKADYPDRHALLEALGDAADAFDAAPSNETYLQFNRALRAVETNTPQSALHPAESAAGTGATDYYDLQGRKVGRPAAGAVYLTGDGAKVRK